MMRNQNILKTRSTIFLLISGGMFLSMPTHAQILWQENFNSSPNLSSYIGSGVNQFASYQAGAGTSNNWSIVSNRLVGARVDSLESATLLIEASNFNGSINDGFILTANIGIQAFTNAGQIARITTGNYSGGGFSGPTTSFDFRSINTTDYDFSANGAGGGGTWNTNAPDFTWVVNNSGSSFTYIGPDSNPRTLGTGLYDLWIGSNASGSRLGVAADATTYNAIQFQLTGWLGGSANSAGYLDNVVITAIPEPTSAFLIGFAASLLMLMRKRLSAQEK